MSVAILSFPGSAGVVDVQAALVKAGLSAEDCHVVSPSTDSLESYDAVIIIGGVSFGSAVRPGALAALTPVIQAVKHFATLQRPILGIDNGFHILTEAGLLPGFFLENQSLTPYADDVSLTVHSSRSIITNKILSNTTLTIPVSQRYGKYAVTKAMQSELDATNGILLTYTQDNPLGSFQNIGAVKNESGNIVGMLPFPERAVDPNVGSVDGLCIFESFVASLQGR